MLNTNRKTSIHMNEFDRTWRRSKMIFTIFAALFLVIFMAIFGSAAWLSVACYTSNDPSSMACYMISERADVTIRSK